MCAHGYEKSELMWDKSNPNRAEAKFYLNSRLVCYQPKVTEETAHFHLKVVIL